jgi:hypothetical protein
MKVKRADLFKAILYNEGYILMMKCSSGRVISVNKFFWNDFVPGYSKQ